MALKDPIAAYHAANDVEAHMLCDLLIERGIEAHVIEDNSAGELFSLGALSEIHRPQIWIERTDIERAKPVLDEFEQSLKSHSNKDATVVGTPIEVTCDECGEKTKFPGDLHGTVQECPKCTAYLDVGVVEGDWGEMSVEEETDEE